ncbi:guanine deaminase [Roseivivax halotolerans]|uniref:Guanine deaminase n=1 Tax=Roseivivax halotolerans TaxID=93684 RepID=A0A1I5ZJ11_9RHOB|nr:guanine deaminase [Roseivivax halotolerans]SFQ56107.1 guanine deaminase [Roseivivax halotolerans]
MQADHLLTGRVLVWDGAPLRDGRDVARIEEDWGVLIAENQIAVTGPADMLRQAAPDVTETAYGRDLICPGFVDAHVHFPQTRIIASWGKRLIDWLNTYTFPEEMRLEDPAYAAAVAGEYLDLVVKHGTTTVASFCTSHPASVDAFFEAAERREMRVYAGKTCMDRNAPDALCDTAIRAYDESRALIERWHGRGRASYVITPRFSPTSSQDQLEALGALWTAHPDCLMQTHLSEQIDEVDWVASLFPDARDYLDTYEAVGLLGERALFGHAIHLTPREIDRIAETGAALVHCPTSNTFIGSGLFDMGGLTARGIPFGLATDTGGGSSFSMLRTMAAAYEIGQLRGRALHASELLWLATEGSAEALHAKGRIGTLAPGAEADICVLDLASTEAIAQRTRQAETVWDEVFATIMMGDDRAVRSVWVAGERRI